jgi:phosphoribosylformylglycinamidine synthase
LIVRVEGTDSDVRKELRRIGVDLSPDEARRIRSLVGRDPTLTEAFIFDIMWSEHCSYKSSKEVLRRHLPTEGERVVIGPGEDAGVVRLGRSGGKTYVLVVAHESHNHPSQILPVEGAATGIGGIVRDVYCMGADVIGVMDALRFGDPAGPRGETVREIAAGVVTGIWEYGNALGVPNAGGDVFFDSCYDENCLVNVIAFGVTTEDGIIRSRVPERARSEPYDLILVGKPTDTSGLGGATMASRILDDGKSGVGSVQLHDPFLKRVLTEATKSVLDEVGRAGAEIGFKDLGAGGIACAVSEIVSAAGLGADIDLSRVHVAFDEIESFAIACSETQERYCLAVPASLTDSLMKIYNDDFELPHIYRGARASLIGRVTRTPALVMRRGDEKVVDVPVDAVTSGICYERRSVPIRRPPAGPAGDVGDLRAAALKVLALLSNCSKHFIYRHYDAEVKGMSVLKPGEADACVTRIAGTPMGVATSVDGNPMYSRRDPYRGGAMAVCESMRNVACVGAIPIALTDCLNFGNPEDPGVFHDFVRTVRGIGDAARQVTALDTGMPVPVISGNVSFYNESSSGAAILPSPVVACYGVLDDYSIAGDLTFKHAGSDIVLVGKRVPGLGGSALLRALGADDTGTLPELDLESERNAIHAVTGAVRGGLVAACHDIAEGGLFTALAEMVIGGWGRGLVGAQIRLDQDQGVSAAEALFGEAGGFVLEVVPGRTAKVLRMCSDFGVHASVIGMTVENNILEISAGGFDAVFDGPELRSPWLESLEDMVR